MDAAMVVTTTAVLSSQVVVDIENSTTPVDGSYATLVCALALDDNDENTPTSPKIASVLQVLEQEEEEGTAVTSAADSMAGPRTATAVLLRRRPSTSRICPERVQPCIVLVFPLLLVVIIAFVAYTALQTRANDTDDLEAEHISAATLAPQTFSMSLSMTTPAPTPAVWNGTDPLG